MDAMSDEKKKAKGWGRPTPTARKFHYFDGFRSLCGNYGWLGPADMLEEGKDIHPENCKACQKKLAERHAKEANS
jgi:hypothetical protein